MSFCRDQAPAITAEMTRRTGWSVGRTSLLTRNPASAPDAYERTVMAGFNELVAVGTPVASLRESDVLGGEGDRAFRYVQAIPIGEVCLAGHGSKIRPEVKARIEQLYPSDRATGFSLGDMRGVFTLKQEAVSHGPAAGGCGFAAGPREFAGPFGSRLLKCRDRVGIQPASRRGRAGARSSAG